MEKRLTYDTVGNITKKNDICNTTGCFGYSGGSSKPHELTSIAGTYNGVTNPSFSYDQNGNLLNGAGRSFGWMSFNKPSTITDGGTSLALAYGAEHERYKLCSPSCTSPTSTTLYLYDPATGGMSEKVVSGSATNWRDYIVADGQIVAVRSTPLGQVKWTYVVGDHLGSPTTFTDANKVVTESASAARPPARAKRATGGMPGASGAMPTGRTTPTARFLRRSPAASPATRCCRRA